MWARDRRAAKMDEKQAGEFIKHDIIVQSHGNRPVDLGHDRNFALARMYHPGIRAL